MGFFDDIIPAPISKAVQTIGRVNIGPISISNMGDAVRDVSDSIQKLPILGSIYGIMTPVHLVNAGLAIAEGQRVDKAAIGVFKKKIGDYKAIAPYAASIVSFVPAVGPGVGAGIAAGAALADGQPLSKVAIEAVKGAIPGGHIAQAAFSIAQGAAEGKSIDQIAINALPVAPQAKQAMIAAIALTKDLASGKPVDQALIAHVDDALKILGPELGKALSTGLAVGIGKAIQDSVVKQLANPEARAVLEHIGRAASSGNPLISSARNLNPSPLYQKGFDVGVGIINGKKVSPAVLAAARDMLIPALGPGTSPAHLAALAQAFNELKGFDTALALNIGQHTVKLKMGKLGSKKPVVTSAFTKRMMSRKNKPKAPPAQAAGFFITQGLPSATEKQKVEIMKDIIQNPEAKAGAVDAIKDVAAGRTEDSLWTKIMKFFGL